MVSPILILAVVLPVAFAFYKWATINKDYFSKKNVPHLKPYFLVGSTGGLFTNRYALKDYATYIYNAMPNEKIFGMFDIRSPTFVVRDANVLKQLAVKDYEYFQDHRPFIDEKSDVLFGNSLIMLHGQKWRDMRATLSPAFTGSKMRQMFMLINECAQAMTAVLKRQANEGKQLDFEMKEMFARYANDVIASAAFGVKVNSFEDKENEFFLTGKNILRLTSVVTIIKVICLRFVPWLTQWLGIPLLDGPSSKYFKALVLDTMNVRKKNSIFRPDMINTMMQLRQECSGVGHDVANESTAEPADDSFATVQESSVSKVTVRRTWTDDELVAQCFVFFLAGFDTSSMAMSLTAHELAIHPDVQDKLYREIGDTHDRLNGKQLSYDDLSKMKYMDQVFSESLRMWPPLNITDRICNKDYEYNDGSQRFRIEKGAVLMIPIYGYHHDPKNFPQPEQFDPERFSDENKHNIVPGTYIPFGIGPRNCIGSRLALMEVKAVMYYMLLHFKIEPNEKTQIPLKMAKSATGVVAERGINLQLKLR